MRRLVLAVLAAVMLTGLLAAAAPAASARLAPAHGPAGSKAGPVTVSVSATKWTPTGVSVRAGELLRITATGAWTDGSTTSGPNGAAKPWPDNFFNLADLGVCADCATTDAPNWGALIGYVGTAPPPPGSYASTAVRPQALRVFYVGGSYEAQALASGPLWLFKNADAYSGYIADNSGHVTAKITVLPPESASQAAARARVAALSVSALAPVGQAWNSCAQSIESSLTEQAIENAVLSLLPLSQAEKADTAIEGLTIVGDTLEVDYDVSGGQIFQSEFDFGKVVFDILGDSGIPGFFLFGLVGTPAIDCVEAGFWLAGTLGGQIGTLLRKRFLAKADTTAGIAGTWTLIRSTISCVVDTCYDTPMVLKFTHCSQTECTMTRLDYIWKKSHPIALKNGRWTAKFTDITATCGTAQVPGNITLTLAVTSYAKSGGTRVAKTLGGTYDNVVPPTPPQCPSTASLFQDLYGGRS